MAEREFMSLGFYALLRVLYSLWTSIIKIHLYNCLRRQTPRVTQEELPKVLWRHFSHHRPGESPSTDTPECHALGWGCLAFLLCASWELHCSGPKPQLAWKILLVKSLWYCCTYQQWCTAGITAKFPEEEEFKALLIPLNCAAFYPEKQEQSIGNILNYLFAIFFHMVYNGGFIYTNGWEAYCKCLNFLN